MPSETAPNIRANRVMATTSSTIVNPASAPAGTTGRLRTLMRTSDRGRGRRGHGRWRTAVRLIGSTRGELNPPEGLLEDGLALAEGERAAGGPELGAALADVDHPVGTGDGAALGRLVALAAHVHLDVAHAAAAEDAEQRQLAPGAGATARAGATGGGGGRGDAAAASRGGGRGGAAADQRLERVLGGERDRRRRRHGGGGRRHARLGRGGGGGPGPAAAGRRGEHDLGRRGRPAAEGRGDQRVEHQQHHAVGGVGVVVVVAGPGAAPPAPAATLTLACWNTIRVMLAVSVPEPVVALGTAAPPLVPPLEPDPATLTERTSTERGGMCDAGSGLLTRF